MYFHSTCIFFLSERVRAIYYYLVFTVDLLRLEIIQNRMKILIGSMRMYFKYFILFVWEFCVWGVIINSNKKRKIKYGRKNKKKYVVEFSLLDKTTKMPRRIYFILLFIFVFFLFLYCYNNLMEKHQKINKIIIKKKKFEKRKSLHAYFLLKSMGSRHERKEKRAYTI